MKIAIVTSSEFSFASLLLEERLPFNVEAILVLNQTTPRPIGRIIKKIVKVGVLGVAVGYISRGWYRQTYKSVLGIAKKKKIAIYKIYNFDVTPEIKDALRGFDLGISMGNGFIRKSFFSLFNYGMINIHHEILPDYPGAQSVVWPLAQNRKQTGFTIHFISAKIDKGDIILSKKRPIIFKNSLQGTVRYNYQESLRLSIIALVELLGKPVSDWKRSPNVNQVTFTTPTFKNWMKAYKNFANLKVKGENEK